MSERESLHSACGVNVTPVFNGNEHLLHVSGEKNSFEGEINADGIKIARYTPYNAEVLRSLFPWTRPVSVLRTSVP